MGETMRKQGRQKPTPEAIARLMRWLKPPVAEAGGESPMPDSARPGTRPTDENAATPSPDAPKGF